MVGAFNIPLSMMYKTDKQQISREIKKFLLQYTTKTKQTYIECSIQKKKKKKSTSQQFAGLDFLDWKIWLI